MKWVSRVLDNYKSTLTQITFTTDLYKQYKKYKKLTDFVYNLQFFADQNAKLVQSVQQYFSNNYQFEKAQTYLAAIDAAYRLHPFQYQQKSMTQQQLLSACLRQNKFVNKISNKNPSFDLIRRQYLQFLYLYKTHPHQIVSPTLAADFLWHSHMQNPQAYFRDTSAYLGVNLNHRDDFSKEQLRSHQTYSLELRKKFLPHLTSVKSIFEQKEPFRKTLILQQNRLIKSKHQKQTGKQGSCGGCGSCRSGSSCSGCSGCS